MSDSSLSGVDKSTSEANDSHQKLPETAQSKLSKNGALFQIETSTGTLPNLSKPVTADPPLTANLDGKDNDKIKDNALDDKIFVQRNEEEDIDDGPVKGVNLQVQLRKNF